VNISYTVREAEESCGSRQRATERLPRSTSNSGVAVAMVSSTSMAAMAGKRLREKQQSLRRARELPHNTNLTYESGEQRETILTLRSLGQRDRV
jgi:hypothetical protein